MLLPSVLVALIAGALDSNTVVMCPYPSSDTSVVLPLGIFRSVTIAITERNFMSREIASRVVVDSLLRKKIEIDSLQSVKQKQTTDLCQENIKDVRKQAQASKLQWGIRGAGIGVVLGAGLVLGLEVVISTLVK